MTFGSHVDRNTYNVPIIVFEKDQIVYVYKDLDEAANSIEAVDLIEGFFVGAYTVDGLKLDMSPGDLFIKMTPSYVDRAALIALLKSSTNSPLADDPRAFAAARLADER